MRNAPDAPQESVHAPDAPPAVAHAESKESLLAHSSSFDDRSKEALICEARTATRSYVEVIPGVHSLGVLFVLLRQWEAISPPMGSAAASSKALQRSTTLDGCLDVLSVQEVGQGGPAASHAAEAKQARDDGATTLADACRMAKRRNMDLALPKLSPEGQKRYKGWWEQFRGPAPAITPTPHTMFFLPDGTPAPPAPDLQRMPGQDQQLQA